MRVSQDVIEKIAYRLQAAADAKARLDKVFAHPMTYRRSTFRRDWSEYLHASASVFVTLEQAAKALDKPQYWWGGVRGLRRRDPLLSYLHHARNAEEHGLEAVVGENLGRVSFLGDAGEIASIDNFNGKQGVYRAGAEFEQGKHDLSHARQIRLYPSVPKLVAVRDRGVVYQPPTSHLGLPLRDCNPCSVANLQLAYVKRVVNEFRGLAART